MQNEKHINQIWSRFNAIRGYTVHSDISAVLFLLKKTKDKITKSSVKYSEQEIYKIMLLLTEMYEIENPFPDSKAFYSSLFSFDNEEIDWEMVLASEDPKEMFYIPKVLIDEFEKHFTSDIKIVLVAEAEKYVPYLGELVQHHSECEFFLTTMNSVSKALLDEIFKDHENVVVEQTSIYEYEFTSRKFDLILSVPVFGVRQRAEKNSEFICREFEMIAVENLLLHLSSYGKLIIVLPARITFAAGPVKALREFVQEMYKLEEIAALPAGIFPTTGIKTYMFTISSGRTEDVFVKKYDFSAESIRKDGLNELILIDETFVMIDELLEMSHWNIDHIFYLVDEEWQKYQNSGYKKEELGNLAEVFRGKSTNKKTPNGGIGVINISNINDYYIDYESLDYIDEEERKISNYLLKDGDVLLPARGTATRIAIFQEQNYPCIASSNLIVIRPNDKLLSGTYLKIFLDSSVGSKVLAGKQQGTVVINISYKDLKTLEIPVLSIEAQNEIAEEYKKEFSIYLESIRLAENRWKVVVERLQENILKTNK